MEELNYILETFGDVGNGRYLALRGLVMEMQRQADAADAAANKILDIVHRFKRLIEIAEKKI